MSLANREGQEVANLLLKNFASLLCSQLAIWLSLDCELQYSFICLEVEMLLMDLLSMMGYFSSTCMSLTAALPLKR